MLEVMVVRITRSGTDYLILRAYLSGPEGSLALSCGGCRELAGRVDFYRALGADCEVGFGSRNVVWSEVGVLYTCREYPGSTTLSTALHIRVIQL